MLRQRGYIEKMVATYLPDGLPHAGKGHRTPCGDDLPDLINQARLIEGDPDPAVLKRYQSIVGAINYTATHTRCDVALAVGLLSRAMHCPTPPLLLAAERVLGYLHRTRHLGLFYEAEQCPMSGMSDSDWAVKHSTSGFVFTFCKAAINWGSRRQQSVALSSCEAEIVTASEAGNV